VRTIGVSVAVPEPWGSELQRYRVALGDASAAGIPTHITLLPPVEVEDEELPEILGHLRAAAAATRAFPLHLRGTGTFRPVSPVVFVNVVEGISCCEQLAGVVRHGPLAVEPRYPYHPHVTVAHHLEEALLDRAFAELAGFECRFSVESISLYSHEGRRGWSRFHDLPLGSPG